VLQTNFQMDRGFCGRTNFSTGKAPSFSSNHFFLRDDDESTGIWNLAHLERKPSLMFSHGLIFSQEVTIMYNALFVPPELEALSSTFSQK
jgi:hypothetical protein